MIRRFFKNAGILIILELILKLKGLIIIPLLTRHFGTLDYGAWSQVLVLVNTVSPLIILGTDSGFIRHTSGKSLEEQKSSLSAWILFLLGTAVVVCVLLIGLRGGIARAFFNDTSYTLFIPLACASMCFTMLLNCTKNWFKIHNNAKMYSKIFIYQALLNLAAVIVTLVGEKGVYELVVYTIVADSIVVLWFFVVIWHNYGWGSPDFSVLKPFLKFGLPLVPSGYAMWGLNSMDRIFLVHYGTLSDIGVYSLSYTLGYLIIQIFVNPVWTMYPNNAAELYNQGKTDELQMLFSYSMKIILVLCLPALVGLFVLGEPIISFFATEEFLAGAPLMAIITLGYLFLMLGSYYDTSVGLVFKQYYSTLSLGLACGVNLVLNLLLIPRYLILGAAVATCLSFLFHLAFIYWMARRHLWLKLGVLFPLKITGISLVLGVFLYMVKERMNDFGIVSLALLIFAGMVVYGILLFVFRVVTLDFIGQVKDMMMPRLKRSTDD